MGGGPKEAASALLRNRKVWFLLLTLPLIYSIAVAFTPYQSLISEVSPQGTRRFFNKMTILPVRTFLLLVLPLGLLWWEHRYSVSKNSPYEVTYRGYYGLGRGSGHWKAYLLLGGVALAGAFAASFSPQFLKFYPMYKPGRELEILDISKAFAYTVWELVYGTSFIGVEFFFRGVMIYTLARFLGPGAIWVAASMYLFIHFGKPPVEAITSFFGGIILGIVSLRSGTILGGVMLHLALALGMDAFALLRLLK